MQLMTNVWDSVLSLIWPFHMMHGGWGVLMAPVPHVNLAISSSTPLITTATRYGGLPGLHDSPTTTCT